MTTELTLNPNLADELKSLRRAKSTVPVVISTVDSPSADVGSASGLLSAVERLPVPTILAVSGPLDAVVLALCCACTIAYVDPDTTLGAIDPATALQLGLAGRLTERFGPGAAARLLLGDGDPLALAVAAPDPLAAARATAARLAEPAAALLPRSLAFAARSTHAQSAAYDSELLALLTDTTNERPR
jgi:enoyl-CoA hydratase/carnithine racemase